MKVYITGMGAVSALGNDVAENYRQLIKEKTGLAPIQLLESRFKEEGFVAGEVKLTNSELAAQFNLTNDQCTRTTLLGLMAVREAMAQASCLDEDNSNTAFISSTTVAGMVRTENHYLDFLNKTNTCNFLDTHDNGYHAACIAAHFNIKGYLTTINTACSSSANALILGARLIQSGFCDRVIAGGTDAFCKYTINGFNSLMLIDKEPCKPFDKNRKGINLGEAAAYMVLESEKMVQKKGAKTLATLSGYGVMNDAFHQTSVSPNGLGIQLSIQEALKRAGLNPEDIHYINAHGTGTNNNDLTEGIALKEVHQNNVPPFSSTKSYTGHTLAAAGSIEGIYSVLALQNKTAFSNLNFKEPISEHGLVPVNKTTVLPVLNNVLSNSIGIGGFCSSLVFSGN